MLPVENSNRKNHFLGLDTTATFVEVCMCVCVCARRTHICYMLRNAKGEEQRHDSSRLVAASECHKESERKRHAQSTATAVQHRRTKKKKEKNAVLQSVLQLRLWLLVSCLRLFFPFFFLNPLFFFFAALSQNTEQTLEQANKRVQLESSLWFIPVLLSLLFFFLLLLLFHVESYLLLWWWCS